MFMIPLAAEIRSNPKMKKGSGFSGRKEWVQSEPAARWAFPVEQTGAGNKKPSFGFIPSHPPYAAQIQLVRRLPRHSGYLVAAVRGGRRPLTTRIHVRSDTGIAFPGFYSEVNESLVLA